MPCIFLLMLDIVLIAREQLLADGSWELPFPFTHGEGPAVALNLAFLFSRSVLTPFSKSEINSVI